MYFKVRKFNKKKRKKRNGQLKKWYAFSSVAIKRNLFSKKCSDACYKFFKKKS